MVKGVPAGISFRLHKNVGLNVGLLISNCCMCSREMKVEVMNITMHRNVIKMFRIVIRILLVPVIASKLIKMRESI